MTEIYLSYRKREEGDLFEISILASSEKIEKNPEFETNIALKLDTNLKPESAISQLRSSIFGNPEGARGIDDKDKLEIVESNRENELRLIAPRNLVSRVYENFLEYIVLQVRDKKYDKLSER